MNNEIKGMCLFFGMVGLAYVGVLLLIAAFSGYKILKSTAIIITVSAGLITLGLNPSVRRRLWRFAQDNLVPKRLSRN